MVNHLLLNFINRELGVGKPTARDNYAYHCPFCNHRKPKLEIQIDESSDGKNAWNCWACNTKGKSIVLLFKKIGISKEKEDELKKIVKDTKNYDVKKEDHYDKLVTLPKEFKSLFKFEFTDIEAKHAFHYLKTRNITKADIIKYNIGFCERGKYAGRILIPIYNSNNELIFYENRTYKDDSIRYIKPSYSRDIIANEHLINWSLPIILCEGVFDAIAIKRNVIPLLGKTISSELMKKLLISTTKKIYIVLDKDAIKKALEFCELLMNEGKDVYLVEMGDDDASKMGFESFTYHIQKCNKLTYSSLLEKKLNL